MRFRVLSCVAMLGVLGEVRGELVVMADYLFMRRTLAANQSIVEDTTKLEAHPDAKNTSILNVRNLVHNFKYESGYRVGLTIPCGSRVGLELLFMNLNEWHAQALRNHRAGFLHFPFKDSSLTHDFVNADSATAHFTSRFKSWEANVLYRFGPKKEEYWVLSAIIGPRVFCIDEKIDMAFTRGRDTSHYRSSTNNIAPALQLGFNLKMSFYKYLALVWRLEGGPLATRGQMDTFLGDRADTVTLLNKRDTNWKPGLFAEGDVAFAWQPWRYTRVRLGYEFIYLYRLATAPIQLHHKPITSGRHVNINGDALIHGLFAGIAFTY
jgi:hypothetical protein